MPRLKCPRCATVVDVAPGARPQCPACGFGSASPPPAPEAAPPPPAPAPPLGTAPAFSPLPPGAAARPPRPGWVTFVGVYWLIGASFALVVGLVAVLAGGTLAAAFEEGYGEFGDVVGGLILVLGVLLLALGALGILLGVNVMKGRNWARVTTLVLAILGIAFGAIGFLASTAMFLSSGGSPPGGELSYPGA